MSGRLVLLTLAALLILGVAARSGPGYEGVDPPPRPSERFWWLFPPVWVPLPNIPTRPPATTTTTAGTTPGGGNPTTPAGPDTTTV